MSASLETAFHTVGLFENTKIRAKRSDYGAGETIYAQGDNADAVLYIEHGTVRTCYISPAGKQGVVSLLKPGDFIGIGCIAGCKTRRLTAIALTACSVLRVETPVMIEALRTDPNIADRLISALIGKSTDYQEALTSHLFHSAEERLARILLRLARLGEGSDDMVTLPKISHETLASMVGTTRAHITTFTANLRRQGLIESDGHLRFSYERLKQALDERPGRAPLPDQKSA